MNNFRLAADLLPQLTRMSWEFKRSSSGLDLSASGATQAALGSSGDLLPDVQRRVAIALDHTAWAGEGICDETPA